MDKFVGSSEKNLREIFDNPPELYFEFKKNYGEPLSKTALHVIVLDEFDAIARARGGSGGKGDQVTKSSYDVSCCFFFLRGSKACGA
jgi:SpoVK/Ycf46/Vps4 family AAA+-type ATPase